ncbi:MAG: hypothetical protein H0V70_27695 [Ktedonobacteraceae bacterium]|nr:hypothetical protein [Ktedonobacteraceae bacterium]
MSVSEGSIIELRPRKRGRDTVKLSSEQRQDIPQERALTTLAKKHEDHKYATPINRRRPWWQFWKRGK